MADEVARAEENVEVVREIIALFRLHADELRAKGLDVDAMIRDLEEKIADVLAAAKKVGDLTIEDEYLTREREKLRKDIEGMTSHLPPDLVDGMATNEYLHEAAKRELERRRRKTRHQGG